MNKSVATEISGSVKVVPRKRNVHKNEMVVVHRNRDVHKN